MKIMIYVIILSTFSFSNNANEINPFKHFIGEWTLKGDTFNQVWDGKTLENLKIANHNTVCEPINTSKSILCVIDAGELKGHILWTFDSSKQHVHHLSHFGDSRNGVGFGTLDKNGNLNTNVRFQGEPKGSYRIYQYQWLSKDEYTMHSAQYNEDGTPTGNWYGGTFIRKSP